MAADSLPAAPSRSTNSPGVRPRTSIRALIRRGTFTHAEPVHPGSEHRVQMRKPAVFTHVPAPSPPRRRSRWPAWRNALGHWNRRAVWRGARWGENRTREEMRKNREPHKTTLSVIFTLRKMCGCPNCKSCLGPVTEKQQQRCLVQGRLRRRRKFADQLTGAPWPRPPIRRPPSLPAWASSGSRAWNARHHKARRPAATAIEEVPADADLLERTLPHGRGVDHLADDERPQGVRPRRLITDRTIDQRREGRGAGGH